MSEIILKTSNLTKKYHNKPVINEINFCIESGKIYGFIGENGAGKTTTIRMLTGLSDKTSGEIEIFGTNTHFGLKNARKKIGAIVERPILFVNQTAEQNLKMQCILYKKKNHKKIPELLEKVGLINIEGKKVGNFSLGMKQRLGIAMALVQEPELLILDEPVNGLDPMGMIEVRNLLIKLNKEDGITILVSSHILTELYMLATDYIIISHGKILAQLTSEELSDKCRKTLVIKMDEKRVDDAVNILKEHFNICSYEVKNNEICIYDDNIELVNTNRVLCKAGIYANEIKFVEKTLEQYYVEVMGGV